MHQQTPSNKLTVFQIAPEDRLESGQTNMAFATYALLQLPAVVAWCCCAPHTWASTTTADAGHDLGAVSSMTSACSSSASSKSCRPAPVRAEVSMHCTLPPNSSSSMPSASSSCFTLSALACEHGKKPQQDQRWTPGASAFDDEVDL